MNRSPRCVFVTGGAGFIGGSLVAALLGQGSRVTVFDDLSGVDDDWWTASGPFLRPTDGASPPLSFIRGDVRDLPAVESALGGHDLVIHLAAHTDIAGGAGDPTRDLESGVIGTWNVLEAMRRRGVRALFYASSGTVYGYPSRVPTPEDHGPLLPESHYAAAKLAGEALISGFAALNGWRSIIFRFGNTIGARSNHGVVHDLVVKLLRDPTRLQLLGDGQQRKPYVAVEDVVAGMLVAGVEAPERPVSIYNIGTAGTLTVARVAELVIEALRLDARSVDQRSGRPSAIGGGGWPGDTPLVDFDTSALRALGWAPRWSAEDAVRRAARGTHERLLARGTALLTASERRASVPPSAPDGRETSAGPPGMAGHDR